MADVGTGATLTFATSSWAAQLTSINGNDISRESVETSHLGTTGGRTFIPGDLYDPGELEVEFIMNTEDPSAAANFPPYTGAAETVTLAFPLASGDTTAAQVSGSGFMTNFSFGNPLEDLVTGSATIKFSGNLTWADAAG